MDVKRITEYEELDQILPLIHKLHEMIDSPYPLSAFIGYIAMNLKNPFQAIWVGYETGRPVGYAIGSIQATYFDPECVLVDTYMEKIDEVASTHVWDLVVLWAKENGCKRITGRTKRDAVAVQAKYGFKPEGQHIMKEL